MLDLMPGKSEDEDETLAQKTQAALARYGSRFLGPYFKKGAVERTQVYLVMSHDSKIPEQREQQQVVRFAMLTTSRQPSRTDAQG